MFTSLTSLMAGRIAGLAEIAERAKALALPDDAAVVDHADSFERVPAPDRDPLHIFAELGVEVRDLRDVPDAKRPARGRSVGLRPVSQVTGLCWHQTAAAGLGPDHPRLLGLPAHCHVGALRDGAPVVTLLHRVTAYVYHGHGWNRSTIGIEVQARAAGIEGDPLTFWRSRSEKARGLTMADLVREATASHMLGCTASMRYYAALMDARECPLQCLTHTHRQSATKAGDPGSRIARHVHEEARALGWTIDHSSRVLGKGKPQPDAWTGLEKGVRYR